MPSIDNQKPSQSVVQFFNMFGSQANAHPPPPPTVTKTPNRSTHTRKNSKQLQARASSLSPKPNRQNKLPKNNNNTTNNNKHNTTPNHKFNAKHDNRNNANGSNSGRTPQRNSTRGSNCSNRDTGKQQQHKTTTNTSKHKNNCPQNENHSDSSLSVKSSKSSFVKLATLTNKSDPDSDNGGSTNNHQRYNTRARYQRNSESSFHFENQANSELFAGSSSAPDAKSLPLPPTAWLGAVAIGKPSGNSLNNVPKNHLLKNNNAPQIHTESNSLNPTVQNLFASMALVSTSA